MMSTYKESFAWPPITTKRACDWCTCSCWQRDTFPELCKSPWRLWPSNLLLDLQFCGDCVNEYHQIRDDFIETKPEKKKELWSGDVQRLSFWIKQALDSTNLTSCTTLEILNSLENKVPAIPQYHNTDNLKQALDIPIREILQFPELLFDVDLSNLFVGAVTTLIDSGTPPDIDRENMRQLLPGLSVLLIHPSPKLRKWAERKLKRWNKVTMDDFDMLTDIVHRMVEVASLNLFENAEIFQQGPIDICEATYLPGHLYQQPCIYWNGLLRLLINMTKEVISLRLMGVSGHRDLPDTIINVIDGAHGKEKATFWSAFNCFVIILESCGSRLWPSMMHTPNEVLDIITSHPVYLRQVKQHTQGGWCDDTLVDNDSQSFSQEFSLGSQSLSRDSLPKAALTWFKNFVMSVLDFGDVGTRCVSSVIGILDHYSGNLDVRVKILSIVSRIVRMSRLSSIEPSAHLWLPHVLELATKLDDTNAQMLHTAILPARDVIKSILKRDIDFKDLSADELEAESIVNQLKKIRKTEEIERNRPKCKRNCARKSMWPARKTFSPPTLIKREPVDTATITIKQEKQDGCSTVSEQKESKLLLIAECDIKKEENAAKSHLNVKRKANSLKTASVSTTLLNPVIKLEDCRKAKPTHSSNSSNRGTTKELSINLDSDEEEPAAKSFFDRSLKLSKERLKRIRPKSSSLAKMDSSSSSLSSTTKRLLESDSEDELISVPRRVKRRVVESEDDTESLDEESDSSSPKLTKSAKRPVNNSRLRRSHDDDDDDETDSLEDVQDDSPKPKFNLSLKKLRNRGGRPGTSSPNGSQTSVRNSQQTSSRQTPCQYHVQASIVRQSSPQACNALGLGASPPTDTLPVQGSASKSFSEALSNYKAMTILNREVKKEPSSTTLSQDESTINENIKSFHTPHCVVNEIKEEKKECLISYTDSQKNEIINEINEIVSRLSSEDENDLNLDDIITGGNDAGLAEDLDEDGNQLNYIPLDEVGRDYFGDVDENDVGYLKNLVRSGSEGQDDEVFFFGDDSLFNDIDLDNVASTSGLPETAFQGCANKYLDRDDTDSFNDDSLDHIDWNKALEPTSTTDFDNVKPEVQKHLDKPFIQDDDSAFKCVEADMKSSDDESDDDIVEIFCSQNFKSPRASQITIKIEKPDEVLDVAAAQVEPTVQELPATTTMQPLPKPPTRTVATKSLFTAGTADVICTLKLTEDQLVKQVLSWSVDWLSTNNREDVAVYKVLENAERLPRSFQSMNEYCTSFGRLLMIEAWEQVLKDWKDPRSKKAKTNPVIVSIAHDRCYKVLRCVSTNVSWKDINGRQPPEEKDLVIIQSEGYSIFGLIEKVDQEKVYRRSSSGSDNIDTSSERTYNLTYTIRTSSSVRSSEGTTVEMEVVTSLLTTFRQWAALMSFSQRNLLANDILRPRGMKYFCSEEKPKQAEGNERYNKSQVRVIQTASEAVKQPLAIPRICLVQGPPGTGKSHTIVGIVTEILNHKINDNNCQPSQLLPSKPRILICCPSNEGIDELIRKLLRAKPRKTHPNAHPNDNDRRNRNEPRHVNCGDFSLVRVGRRTKIHESVKDVTLESMTRRAMAKSGLGEPEPTAPLKVQLRQIDKRIDAVKKEKFLLGKVETQTEEQHNKFQRLGKQEQSLLNQRHLIDKMYRKRRENAFHCSRMESRLRKDILSGADVVCTTLSGSGAANLNELKGTNGKKIPFSCVIVDEACQCTELDILIPLQYKMSKLILVGDPEQLPATVISKDAKRLLYGRSMFDRLYRFFKELPRHERPVHLLDVQYRMHPEIAQFPSKCVYNDNIHSDSSVLKRTFAIKKHYALFNVHGGREINDKKGSISNMKEAQLITHLCQCLVQSNHLKPTDIGIITPYRCQLMELRKLLRYSGDVFKDIEVNTVDGFQGREKNVIIMSCVRSGKNIGFLECMNRLNVAITRARHALYVFGNLDSLEKSYSWKKLVEDAKFRRLIYEVDSIDDVKRAISLTSSPNRHPGNHGNVTGNRGNGTHDTGNNGYGTHGTGNHGNGTHGTGNHGNGNGTHGAGYRGNGTGIHGAGSHGNGTHGTSNHGSDRHTQARHRHSISQGEVTQKTTCTNTTERRGSLTNPSNTSQGSNTAATVEKRSSHTENVNVFTRLHHLADLPTNVSQSTAPKPTTQGNSSPSKDVSGVLKRRMSSVSSEEGSVKKVRFGETSVKEFNERSGHRSDQFLTQEKTLDTQTQTVNAKSGSNASKHTSTRRSIPSVHSLNKNSNANCTSSSSTATNAANPTACSATDWLSTTSQYRHKNLKNSSNEADRSPSNTHSVHLPSQDKHAHNRSSSSGSGNRNNMTNASRGATSAGQNRHNSNGGVNRLNGTNNNHTNRHRKTTSGQSPSPDQQTSTTSNVAEDHQMNQHSAAPHPPPNQQSSSRTTNAEQSRLDEVASRVRGNNQRPRNPAVISPTGYRVGRAGRLLSLENPTQNEEMRNWNPHGGPRVRRAPSVPGIVQDVRSRGQRRDHVEQVQRPQKRPSLRQNLDGLNKRRRK